MQRIVLALLLALFGCLMVSSAQAGNDCEALSREAFRLGSRVDGCRAGRIVTGAGRLPFHTAPIARCKTRDLFVVPGDKLIAYAEHQGFTAVLYLNPSTQREAEGWVASSRLTASSTGIAPCP
jgi:hypothetical protein